MHSSPGVLGQGCSGEAEMELSISCSPPRPTPHVFYSPFENHCMRDVTEGDMLPAHIKVRESRKGLGITHLVMDNLKELAVAASMHQETGY